MLKNIFQSVDYYEYLFKMSWPALSGLFLVSIFLLVRGFRYVTKVSMRLLLTLGVLMIYGQMFVTNYPDWFNRPSVFKGTVESVQKKEKIPLITIRNGEEEIQLTVDDGIEQSIHQDDLIEVSYLPTKKKVFDCTLLTRQAESHI